MTIHFADADDQTLARQTLACMDLTSLNDGDEVEDVLRLCDRAVTPAGHVAAVCLWPVFVAIARSNLRGTGVKVATVVNFPGGSFDIERTLHQIAEVRADQVDEIDVVLNYADILSGNGNRAADHLAACREACGDTLMKVILETGALAKPALIEKAARIAVDAGADFLKTSTGKVPIGATPSAARVLLEVAGEAPRPVGFKASGGIRDLGAARDYLALADEIRGPGWATPASFRFGASGLLDAVLAALGLDKGERRPVGGY